METNVMLEQAQQQGRQLIEKWQRMPGKAIRGYSDTKTVNFLQGIEEDREVLACTLAQLFENEYSRIRRMDETTRMNQVGSFEKFVFPLIRAIFANLVASELVTVQALNAPTGLVFFFDALYGSQKGRINRGGRMFDARTGPSGNYHYTDEVIEEEVCATGTGIAGPYAFTLAWTPVRAGTFKITDGTQEVTDNGNGTLIGAGTGTINYSTGAVAVTFTAAVANGTSITADHEYNSEANTGIPEIDLMLTSSPVTARPYKLRARWSIESEQDFKAYHGISAEVELVAYMANEIAKEINYKVIRHIAQIAAAGNIVWSSTPPAGVPWIWHKESLYDAFIQGSNLIFAATQRRNATWIVAGVNVCNYIETLMKFKSQGAGSDTAGVRKIGTIGEFTVFKDPTYPTNNFLMGFKGSSFLDTGYIYAPYLGLYTTPTIVLDDMLQRKGMMQRVGLKVINPNMYATGAVTAAAGTTTSAVGD